MGGGINGKVKLFLWVFIQAHFPPLSRCRIAALFVPLSLPSDAGTQWKASRRRRSQLQAPVSGGQRSSRPVGPSLETVLGLIIPSCASSPSPAGLCVPVSSATAPPRSHRSQGETRGGEADTRARAHAH